MPIKFRCQHCRQFLGISRAKAGTITDCPTCGRTIRVPNLDGTVSPLPSPKLDLDDTALRAALGAFASIDSGQTSGDSNVSGGEESAANSPQASPQVQSAVPREESAPVAVAHPLVEVEVHTPSPEVAHSEPPAGSERSISLEELELLDVAVPILDETPEGISRQRVLLACGMSICLGLLIGWIWGRSGVVSPSEGGATTAVAPDAIPEIPVVPMQEGIGAEVPRLALNGRITYETATHETRPDKGARVMLLPVTRGGTAKLTEAGFRANADPIDSEMLRESVRVLGGAFTLADEAGGYQLEKLAAGEYLLVIASRFQSRDNDQTLPQESVQVLNRYFAFPARLLGQVAVQAQFVRLREGETLEIPQNFTAE